LYMMYQNFIKLFFQLFSCKSYDVRRLFVSLDVKCFEAEHMKWIFGLAVPVFIFIVIAWPLMALVNLNRLRRSQGLDSKEVSATFGFLYDGNVSYHCCFCGYIFSLGLTIIFPPSLN
jgi:hypothetical protein